MIWAGGPRDLFPSQKVLNQLKQQVDIWIGADRGALHLIEQGIQPFIATGDFDSVDDYTRGRIAEVSRSMSVYPTEKDETDLEIAIAEALERNVHQLTLVGVTGGRMDHQMMTMQLMEKIAAQNIAVELYEQSGRVWIWPPGDYELRESQAAYVSFLPVSERIEGLTLKGFRYETENAILNRASSLCISNEQTATVAKVHFHSGLLYGVTANE